EVRKLSPKLARARSTRGDETSTAKDERSRVLEGCSGKPWQVLRKVLAVRIHRDGVPEALPLCFVQKTLECFALPKVRRMAQKRCPRCLRYISRAVGRAVVTDDDCRGMCERSPHNVADRPSVVVDRNNDACLRVVAASTTVERLQHGRTPCPLVPGLST